MIQFEHIKKKYGETVILNDISFEIQDGEFTVLIGPSGCGKTTTLKTINRLIEPDGGRILIDGKDTASMDRVELRRSIGYVIQQIGLFPHMTVAQNIGVVPRLLNYDKERCDEIVHELLELVDMPYEQYATKYPRQMSGGQQQRIGVLRALAASPPIVLMDEPFGALDPMTRSNLQMEIKRLQQKLHKTIVFVTHDMDEALDLADRIIFMDRGQIIQMAEPENLLAHPANDLIRSFMGKRIEASERVSMTAADFMRKKVYSIRRQSTVEECIQLMARRDIDTLVVTEVDHTYIGTVSIESIKKSHLPRSKSVETLISTEQPVCETTEDARDCFDKLLDTNFRYIVVLEGRKVAGIVTKTSMVRALADVLWGDEE